MKKIILTLSFVLISSLSYAQTKTTEIVVPFVAGGTMSNVAHLTAEMLTDNGISAFVSNRPGAESVIGANYVSKATPDGRTLLVGAGSSLAANVAFNASGMEYDEKSFSPIVPLGTVGWVVYVQGDSPIKNYEQFKFYVRANPEKFTIGFWNNNYSKLLLAWAEREGLPRPTIINYKGSTPAMTDVIGGHVLVGVVDLQAAKPFYQSKKINVLAVFDTKTHENAVKILGNNDIVDITKKFPELQFVVWYGLWAPAGTPKEILNQLNKIVNTALKDPKNKEKINQFTLHNIGGSAELLYSWQQRDLKLLRSVGAKY